MLMKYINTFQFPGRPRRSYNDPRHLERRPQRRLTWFRNLTTAEIETNFSRDGQSYSMKCPAFVAIVLLLFQTENSLSVESIQSKTKLGDSDLSKTLGVLEAAKVSFETGERVQTPLL